MTMKNEGISILLYVWNFYSWEKVSILLIIKDIIIIIIMT